MRHHQREEDSILAGIGPQYKAKSSDTHSSTLGANRVLRQMARTVRFVELVLTLRSVTSARWVAEYESAPGIEGSAS
jgi:hypothetical protein